jgi:methionyl-tRNA formyltransferase
MKRTLLLGMGPTALSALQSLAERFDVVGIVRPVVSSAEPYDAVTRLARDLSVPVFSDGSLSGVQRAITRTRPDCTVVSSYNRVLGPDILEHGKFVNVHYAALPQYRGRANVNWAIINGEPETAITIHAIEPGLDAGNILFQQAVTIGPNDTAGDLYAALNEIQRRVLAETVQRYLDGYTGIPQDESRSSYGCGRVPADGEIDWSGSTDEVYGLIRALAPPYPGAFSFLGLQRVRIVRASPVLEGPRYVGRIPGRVVGRSRAEGFVDVLTGDGIMRIHALAVDDGDMVPAATVITSTQQTLGLHVTDLLSRISELEERLKTHIEHNGA